jgi:hypothetical protein
MRRLIAMISSVGLAVGVAVVADTRRAEAVPTVLFSSSTSGFTANAATVPAGICFVRILADGGHGGPGNGNFVNAGGAGTAVDARVPVLPGSVLSVVVGGGGGSSVSGGPGGFGGGGAGGNNGGSQGGGGGGGATVVTTAGSPLVVAGGGGGGGVVFVGTQTPGAGGDGGLVGSAGGAGGVGSLGGTSAAGGASTGDGGTGGLTSIAGDTGGGGGGIGAGGNAGGPDAGAGGSGSSGIGGGAGGGGNSPFFASAPGGPGGGGGTGTANGGTGAAGGGAGTGTGGDGGAGGTVDFGDGPVPLGGGGGAGGVGFGGGGGAGSSGGGGGGGYGGGGGGGGFNGGGGGSSFVVAGATDVSSSPADASSGDGLATITYDPATDLCPATHLSVSAPSTATAGSAFSFTVTALTDDELVDTGYNGTVHFTASDPAATLPADATLTNGTGTFTATLNTTGTQTITGTDTVTPSVVGTSGPVAVAAVRQSAPGPPTNVTAVLGSVIVSWTPPSNTGTSPITGYMVTEHPTGVAYGVSVPLTSLTIPCPPVGTYFYTVQAVNANGTSAASQPSNPVTVTTACATTTVIAVPRFTG